MLSTVSDNNLTTVAGVRVQAAKQTAIVGHKFTPKLFLSVLSLSLSAFFLFFFFPSFFAGNALFEQFFSTSVWTMTLLCCLLYMVPIGGSGRQFSVPPSIGTAFS